MKKLAVYLLMLASMHSTGLHAELYAEFSAESGGDEIIGTNFGDSIDAGGGLKLAIGIQNPVNAGNTAAIRLTVGYLFDAIDAMNGDAEFESMTFDALYLLNSGRHRFGAGLTLHMAPDYSDDIIGFAPLKLAFDDALGVVLQYGYQLAPGVEVGMKLTDIEYSSGHLGYDAGSFGVYISNGF